MKNKVVIVTGASSGIGKACAWYFAKNGSKVVLASRNIHELQLISKKMSDKGYQSFAVKTDVSVETDCQNLNFFYISSFRL